MTEKPVKTRAQSTQGLLAIKAGLVKTKLESRRSRTEDGTPVLSYTAIKEAGSSTKINSRAIRESRSFSDPDIYQSLVIFSDAQGLFSMANNVSSFKGVQRVNNKQIPSERPVFTAQKENQRKDNVKNLGFSFEKVASGFDSKHHLAEFSNPLHKGNQPRFRKGGGVLPSKPSVLPKPVVAPKPPKRLTQDTPTISDDPTKSYPKEEADSLSESSPYCDTEEENDPSYASITRERPSVPNHPPPRKLINKSKDSQEAQKVNKTDENGTESCTEAQQQKGDNEQESESQPSVAPLYAQVDKTKKKPHLKNINSDSKISNRMIRSDSDPLPSNISIASGMIYEIREEEESNVKQSSLENEIDIVSESDSEDGWDPEDFDDDDSSDDSRPNSKGETMHFPDQRSKKLYNIAHEILTTERAYVKRLHLLDKVFCFRLHNECFAHGIITADVLPDIFSNISSIHSFHKDFLLPKLEERMSQWNTDNRIGDILKILAPFLKLYTGYIANFDKSSETLSTWTKKSPKFAAIIEEIQKSKDCENLTLGHHMLEPIQRVPRYKLLLKDYLSKLPEDSPDYKDTQDAMGIISEAAAHANDSMKKTEIFKKLLELQERVIEDYDLIAAGRQFIKEGDLTKVSARHVAHQERTLLLFNDVLLCCGKLPGTNKLKVKVEMDLYGMEIGETDDEVELCNTFRVTSKQKVIDFSASSETEREAWILAINDAILEISQKRESYRRGTKPDAIKESELGKKAPVWVRDEAVTMCMSCDTLFTLTRRRHHCRACGEIFCNPCSRLKSHLEYSRKIERVCEKCHKSLAKGATASFRKKSEDEKRHHDVRKISRDCKVLLSGYLNYKSGKGGDKGWAKRWCVLSDTFEFYCYKAKKDQKADFSLPLPGYIVDKPNMADNLDKKIAFKLHHKNFVVYYFSSDSQEVLDSWIHNLSYAVKAERIPETETEESEQATVES